MKTIYIPTTTLNFNNIMSSESVSPKAFYLERGFGYKHWYSIPENPFDNSLLLYEEMPSVTRPQSDYDDYPMVIATSLSEKQQKYLSPTHIPGVFQCDKTIYLTPGNTTILFDTEEHKRITLSKSESSAETKMVGLYKKRMFCATMNKRYDISSCQDQPLCKGNIIRDQRINKMKGFLYGYYIGAAMSMNETDVVRLNALYQMKNILSAIISSLDGKATKEQEQQLQEQFHQFRMKDSLHNQLQFVMESNDLSTDKKFDYVYDLTRNARYRSVYSLQPCSLLKDLYEETSYNEGNPALSNVNKIIKDLLQETKSHNTLLNTESDEITLSSLSLSSVNTKNVATGKPHEMLLAIVNDVLTANKYNGKTSTFMMELANEITYKAKEVFADEWNESCQAKVYLNALRKHIGGEPFNQQWNAGILSSLASVILKGDDWEKLLEFLQSKEIGDYRLAFAIYGILNGFANLTRDFTDILLNQKLQYVDSVYRFFHYQLHEEETFVTEIPGFITPPEKTFKRDYENFLSIMRCLISRNRALYKRLEEETEKPTNEDETLQSLVDRIIGSMSKRSCKEEDRKLVSIAIRLTENICNNQDVHSLLKDGELSDEAIRKIKHFFGSRQLSLFKNEAAAEKEVRKKSLCRTIRDFGNETHTTIFPPITSISTFPDEVQNRLLKNWTYTFEKHPDDRSEHIKHFINLCKQEGRGESKKGSALKGFFNEDIAQKIEQELKNYFHV